MHTTPRPDAAKDIAWVVTTQTAPWRMPGGPAVEASAGVPDVIVQTERPQQTIEGFGACFNELGWTSLAALDAEERDGIFRELFAPGWAPTSPSAACQWAPTISRAIGIRMMRCQAISPSNTSALRTTSAKRCRFA